MSTEYWKPSLLLKAILIWNALLAIVIWLPFIRGPMDGASYAWALPFLQGRGVQGDYWLLVIGTIYLLSMMYFGWRGARLPFHVLVLLWQIPWGIGATLLTLLSPESVRFRGDTLGVDFSLTWLGPILFGGFLVLTLTWIVRDLRERSLRILPPWGRRNSLWLGVVVVMLPVQLTLFRMGVPHGTFDQMGVLLTLFQWAALNVALYPWQPSARK